MAKFNAFKKAIWAIGTAFFFADCKSSAPIMLPEKASHSNATISFVRSEILSPTERFKLLNGSKNCFLDSMQFNPTGAEIWPQNPSFETAIAVNDAYGATRYGMNWALKGWINVAPFEGESPFDLQPGSFGCRRKAAHGEVFAGMVGRDNGTNESMGQILERPLEAGKLYEWSLFGCRSEKYESISRTTGNGASFTKPLILRIWGGKQEGRAEQLFAQTGPIENTGWQKICFVLKPKEPCEALFIEAAHSDLVSGAAYNGNVLIDAVGAIREIEPTKN